MELRSTAEGKAHRHRFTDRYITDRADRIVFCLNRRGLDRWAQSGKREIVKERERDKPKIPANQDRVKVREGRRERGQERDG